MSTPLHASKSFRTMAAGSAASAVALVVVAFVQTESAAPLLALALVSASVSVLSFRWSKDGIRGTAYR
jgi:hypothetical protein